MKKLLLFLIMMLALAAPAMAQTTPDEYIVQLRGEQPFHFWWDAPYDRTLPSGAGWTDGDRVGYRCLYGFLMQGTKILGRVTFTRVPGAEYGMVNDRFMEEGVRYYNGQLDTKGLSQLNDCPAPSLAYEPYTGPDQRPVVTYENKATGFVFETRDYLATVVGEGIKFQQVEKTPQRVTVVGYLNDMPAIVVYYDSMARSVVMDSSL